MGVGGVAPTGVGGGLGVPFHVAGLLVPGAGGQEQQQEEHAAAHGGLFRKGWVEIRDCESILFSHEQTPEQSCLTRAHPHYAGLTGSPPPTAHETCLAHLPQSFDARSTYVQSESQSFAGESM